MSGDEAFTIRGLRARPVREWFQHLTFPFLLMAMAATGGNLSREWLYLPAAVVLIAHFLVKIARGRITLHSDRLVLQGWNDSFLSRTRIVYLREVRKVARHGSNLRIGYSTRGEHRHFRVAVLAPVAEELYDRMLQNMEQLDELGGRIEEQGERRFVVSPEAAGAGE